jgi:hypothetical protein
LLRAVIVMSEPSADCMATATFDHLRAVLIFLPQKKSPQARALEGIPQAGYSDSSKPKTRATNLNLR